MVMSYARKQIDSHLAIVEQEESLDIINGTIYTDWFDLTTSTDNVLYLENDSGVSVDAQLQVAPKKDATLAQDKGGVITLADAGKHYDEITHAHPYARYKLTATGAGSNDGYVVRHRGQTRGG